MTSYQPLDAVNSAVLSLLRITTLLRKSTRTSRRAEAEFTSSQLQWVAGQAQSQTHILNLILILNAVLALIDPHLSWKSGQSTTRSLALLLDSLGSLLSSSYSPVCTRTTSTKLANDCPSGR